MKKVVRDVVSSAPKKASAGGFWDAVVKTRKPTTKNVSETTVSQMLRVIFPEYRLKIIRTFHGAVKENTTKTIAFLIAAEQLEPVKNIVEGTERLEEIKATLMSGECDHMFELDVCEELHQLVAAMVQVEQDMLNGNASPLHMCAVCDVPKAVKWLVKHGNSTEIVDMDGATPLLLAATLNKPRIVEAVCVSGADAEFMKVWAEHPVQLCGNRTCGGGQDSSEIQSRPKQRTQKWLHSAVDRVRQWAHGGGEEPGGKRGVQK